MNAKLLFCVLFCLIITAFSPVASGAGLDWVLSKDGKAIFFLKPPKSFTPYISDSNKKIIYGNLANRYPRGLYWCCLSATIAGAHNEWGLEETRYATGFTPNTDAVVTRVRVAVTYISGNDPNIILSLNSDNHGKPGQVLQKAKVSLNTNGGGCCADVVSMPVHVPVRAGKPYWVVVRTESDSDLFAGWNFNVKDQIRLIPISSSNGHQWSSENRSGLAFEVSGD